MQNSVPSCCCFSCLTHVVPSCNIDCLDTLSSSNCVQFAWRWQDKNERPVLRSLTCVKTLKDRLATFTRDELFPLGCAEKACRTAQRVASWPGALARVHCYVLPRALFIIVFFPIMWTGDWKPFGIDVLLYLADHSCKKCGKCATAETNSVPSMKFFSLPNFSFSFFFFFLLPTFVLCNVVQAWGRKKKTTAAWTVE